MCKYVSVICTCPVRYLMECSEINDSSELGSEILSHEGEQHLDLFHSKDLIKLKNVIRNVVKEACGCFS